MTNPRRALIVIDAQQEYFGGPLKIQYPSPEESLPKITHAIQAATAAGVPVVAVQHAAGEGAPVFDPTKPGFQLHADVERLRSPSWKSIIKQYGSVFADTDLADWLREQNIDTVTFVGFMTNNCVLASAVGAESLGLRVEVLSDATGAIHIANEAGFVDAKAVHTTLLTLLNSNWAAVADTSAWTDAIVAERRLPKSDLGTSAMQGARPARCIGRVVSATAKPARCSKRRESGSR